MGDLESMYRKIVLQVESQAREIQAMISSERIKQAAARAQLEELEHAPPIVLKDPVITKLRERPIGAKN
ncbi:12678_t:CDS:2 [Gigaspora margarita]|uniref:12678_t:CDS:1 n=1 Tax=Gigaspora margarita TaxID=4874 RepID=A0ABM8W1V7_GIGMA|nr:12678_t:CDS:2 [Gigaspora margarita]